MADTIITATIIKSTEKAFQFSIKFWCSTNGGIKTMTRWIPKFACKDNGDGTFSVWAKFIDEITKEFKSKYYSTPKFDLNAFEVEKKTRDEIDARNKAYDKAYKAYAKQLTKDMPNIIKNFLVYCGNHFAEHINVYSHLTGTTPFDQSKLSEVRDMIKQYGISGKGYGELLALSEVSCLSSVASERDEFAYAQDPDGNCYLTMSEPLWDIFKAHVSKYSELPARDIVYLTKEILGKTQQSGEFFDFVDDVRVLKCMAESTRELLLNDLYLKGNGNISCREILGVCQYASKFAKGVRGI